MTALLAERNPAYHYRPELPPDAHAYLGEAHEILPHDALWEDPAGWKDNLPAIDAVVSDLTDRLGVPRGKVITLIRESWESRVLPGQRNAGVEVIAGYGGIYGQADRMGEITADVAIFTNLAGAPILEETKETFYILQKRVSHLFDTNYGGNILDAKISDAPHDTQTVRGVFMALMRRQYEYQPKSTEVQVEQKMNAKWSDDTNVVAKLREFHNHKNHGKWVKTWTKRARKKILSEMRDNTLAIVREMEKAQKRGTRVIVMAGNFDSRGTFEEFAVSASGNAKDTIPVTFVTSEYLEKKRKRGKKLFEVYTQADYIETDNAVIFLLPFFWSRDYSLDKKRDEMRLQWEETLNTFEQKAEEARREGKHVYMYQAGGPEPDLYDLSTPQKLSPSNTAVAETNRLVMARLKPEGVISTQYHDVKKDRSGEQLPPSVHIVFLYNEGRTEPVEDPGTLDDPDMRLTWEALAPEAHHAQLVIPKVTGDRQINLLRSNPLLDEDILPARVVPNVGLVGTSP